MRRFFIGFTMVVFSLALLGEEARGSGFAIFTQGANSLSQGNAVIAHANDASTIFFNPALLNKIEHSEIQAGLTLLSIPMKFESSATGKAFDAEETLHAVPSLYVAYRINDIATAGLGVFSPFGLSTNWGEDWEGRYLATKSSLKTYTINPAVSFKVAPSVYLAGGVDVLFLDADLEKNINLSSFMLPDVKQKLSGDGHGIGFNLGLLVDLTRDISVGASYRSRIDVSVDGDVTHQIPAVVPSPIAAQFPDTPASTSIDLPPQAFIGIAYSGIESFTFEFGGRWEGWSKFKELRIDLERPVAGMTESVMPKNWKDTYAATFGVRYQLSPSAALNAGYLYEKNPIPDSTFDPALPDNTANIFCFGGDITYKKFSLEFVYSYRKNKDRVKDNVLDDNSADGVLNPLTSANGTYKTTVHMIGLDVIYRF